MKKIVLILTLLTTILSCTKKQNIVHKLKDDDKKLIEIAKHFDKLDQIDSAYFYFYKLFKNQIKRKDTFAAAKTNINLLVLEYKMHDFPACEFRSTNTLKYSLPNKDFLKTSTAYNNLGLCAMFQSRTDDAIHYFEKYRLNYQNNLASDSMIYFITYHNNLGNVYAKDNNFILALNYFNAILQVDSMQQKAPLDYARALDNYTYYKSKIKNVKINPQKLLEALQIRINHNEISGMIISYVHLADYFLKINNFEKARQYAQTGIVMSKSINDKYDVPELLKILAKADQKNAANYFLQYQQVTDSLLNKERAFKNNTARIRFETQEKEQQIVLQKKIIKKRNIWIVIGIISFFILLTILHLINKTRKKINRKNKEIESINNEITLQKNLLQQANIQLQSQQEILTHNNQTLTQQNELIEKLKHDIHHRVYNDLKKVQIFIGFENKNNKNTFLNELDGKLDAMLLAHGQLLSKKSYEKVNMNDYLKDLFMNRYHLYANKENAIDYLVKVNAELDSHQAILVGLIVSELLTNTFKHAFYPNDKGKIEILFNLNESTNQYQLDYTDNGKGYTQQEEQAVHQSLGMKLINGFAEQLKGKLTPIPTQQGIHYQLIF